MGYLQEFQQNVRSNDYPRLMQLWEEYCRGEIVDGLELRDILLGIKDSELAASFGAYAETAIPLWKTIDDETLSYQVLRLILDIQTTNSDELADITFGELKKRYEDHKHFNDKIRLIGLRGRENFQGAIRNFELLSHMNKGKFVFHTGGWGTGEILELSLVREELVLEFENVVGRKDFSFQNAFKHLIPLADDHFLAQRFGHPDALEKEARRDPVGVVRMLLKDLGPKTASEIKDEMCELVIPEEDWTKWWQTARSKIKKDTMVETPANIRSPFRLRDAELSHEERFRQNLDLKQDTDDIVQTIYNFVRDFPEIFRNDELRHVLINRLFHLLENAELSTSQRLQIFILLEYYFDIKDERVNLKQFIEELQHPESVINGIDIIAFRKRALNAVHLYRPDWPVIFTQLLFSSQQAALKDYLLKELERQPQHHLVDQKLQELQVNPSLDPETFIWYFQKVVNDDGIANNDKDNQCRFFESFLVLMSQIEVNPDNRDLLKKTLGLLTNDRYSLVRSIMAGATIEFVKEFLLLATKVQSLTDHDIKILHSLAEVVHPSLGFKRQDNDEDEDVVWTTEEGYRRTCDRIKEISEIEMIENAKEIEVARGHGDLRENSEYKFALERRQSLQTELKMLSDSLNKARIITPDDIHLDQIGVGAVVQVQPNGGDMVQYTLLGPWDADPDRNILSIRSKLAQSMTGMKVGESFQFQGMDYTITGIRSFLDV